MSSKLTSRKFWMAVAAFLTSIGTGVTGVVAGNEHIAIAGGICCLLAGGIYAACEAYVDGQSAKSNQTINTTSVSATSASQKVVEKAFGKESSNEG